MNVIKKELCLIVLKDWLCSLEKIGEDFMIEQWVTNLSLNLSSCFNISLIRAKRPPRIFTQLLLNFILHKSIKQWRYSLAKLLSTSLVINILSKDSSIIWWSSKDKFIKSVELKISFLKNSLTLSINSIIVFWRKSLVIRMINSGCKMKLKQYFSNFLLKDLKSKLSWLKVNFICTIKNLTKSLNLKTLKNLSN